jgi:hypothetical protein
MRNTHLVMKLIPFFLVTILAYAGCSPTPPIPYQQLQIQDSEESQGYDVYLYVAINTQDIPEESNLNAKVEELLKWFEQVKFPKANKIKVYIWRNPQSALMNNTGDLLGSIYVDRANAIYELTVNRERIAG